MNKVTIKVNLRKVAILLIFTLLSCASVSAIPPWDASSAALHHVHRLPVNKSIKESHQRQT